MVEKPPIHCQPQNLVNLELTPNFRLGKIRAKGRRVYRRVLAWANLELGTTDFMLRAGLIGYPSTGKTTLFELMTSVRDTARAAHGKVDAHVGIGNIDALGETESGVDVDLDSRIPGVGAHEISLELDAGIGDIRVQRR